MNRHARRAARRKGCWAAYTTEGNPPIHEPAACDGTCHTPVIELADAKMLGAPETRARLLWAVHAGQRALSPSCPVRSIASRLILLAAALVDLAIRRAQRLAVVFRRLTNAALIAIVLRKWASADARQWLALARRALRSHHAHAPPGLGGVVVFCHPRTGPPAARPASEALVISP